MPRSSFYQAIESFKGTEESQVVSFCSVLIQERSAANKNDLEEENKLAIALTRYISITQVYQLTDRAVRQNHFVIIRYGATNTIRPFAMNGSKNYPIDSSHVKSSIKQVISMDYKNHPDWLVLSPN
jgi:DNA integrity scanning protein DisA with diadenylate cyclase activity